MNHLFKTIIDFNFLKKNNLDPNEYVYLYAKYYGLVNVINDLFIDGQEQLMGFVLENKGYVNSFPHPEDEDLDIFELRDKAKALFEETDVDTKFYEFWGNYPIKVPNGTGGYRPLRAKEHTSKQAQDLKKVYISIIKKEIGLHDKIMVGLRNYLAANKSKLTYLVAIDKFIKESMWEMYEDSDREKDKFSVDV